MSKPTSAVKRKYNEKAYDQIVVFLPRGTKDYIKRAAQRHAMSMTGLISEAVLHYLGKGGRDWRDIVGSSTPTILPEFTIDELVKKLDNPQG